MGVPPFLLVGVFLRWYPFFFTDTIYDTLAPPISFDLYVSPIYSDIARKYI
jgi:hypothetical protein